MDHAQGRVFHHHLARAIMHLNHLAGLLPFFELSIEWDDSIAFITFPLGTSNTKRPPHFRSITSITSTHDGITWRHSITQMIMNPKPNLRPTTTHRSPLGDDDQRSGSHNEARNPVLSTEHTVDPSPGTSIAAEPPRTTTRITVPVPVRSKQRASSTEDPQPKKKTEICVRSRTPCHYH